MQHPNLLSLKPIQNNKHLEKLASFVRFNISVAPSPVASDNWLRFWLSKNEIYITACTKLGSFRNLTPFGALPSDCRADSQLPL